MTTPNWPLFGAVVLLLTLGLLVLSRASAGVLAGDRGLGSSDPSIGADQLPDDGSSSTTAEAPGAADSNQSTDPVGSTIPTGVALLANVVLTQGSLGVGLLALAWYASVPLPTVGLVVPTARDLAVGLGVGVGLYLASEAATSVADRVGLAHDERLREALAPDRPAEWVLLLVVLLPIVAGAEELLFRGVLIGAFAAGFGLPVWALAVGSSVLFGASHSVQGSIGVAVTGTLGLVLAAAFVLTGSLATVVLAHYAIDALEFVVQEGAYG